MDQVSDVVFEDFYEELSLLDQYEELILNDDSQLFTSYNFDYSNDYN